MLQTTFAEINHNYFKKVKDTINPNQTKEILKEYLYFIKEEAQAFKDS